MSSRLSFPRPPLMIMDGGADTGVSAAGESAHELADPWGDVMKFIVEVDFPLEPFSTYVRKGTAGEKIGEVRWSAARYGASPGALWCPAGCAWRRGAPRRRRGPPRRFPARAGAQPISLGTLRQPIIFGAMMASRPSGGPRKADGTSDPGGASSPKDTRQHPGWCRARRLTSTHAGRPAPCRP